MATGRLTGSRSEVGVAASSAASREGSATPPAQSRSWLGWLGLIGVLALVLRVIVILGVGFNPDFFDVDGYHAQAIAGLHGPVPTVTHPPGYPWFLIGLYLMFGPRVRLVYLVQALLSTAAVLGVGWAVGRRYGGVAGCVSALVLAIDGYMVIANAALASENLCVPAVAAVIVLLLPSRGTSPWPRLAAAAAAIGLVGLVRTALLGLAAGLAFVELLRLRGADTPVPRRVGRAVLVLLVAVLPTLVFAGVRAVREGHFRIGSPWDTYNLWLGNNPHATGRVEPMPGIPEAGTQEIPDEWARARVMGPRAISYALQHPVREVELVARRASYLFAPPKRDLIYIYGWGWAGERSTAVVVAVYVWAAASVPLLVLLALAAWWRQGCDSGLAWAAVLLFFGVAPYLITIGDARFLLPLHPLIAVAAGAVAKARTAAPSRRRAALVILVGLIFVANAVFDLVATQPALEAILQPGGWTLRPPYHFAR